MGNNQPIYSVTLNVEAFSQNLYSNKEGYHINLTKGEGSSVLAFGASERMKSNDKDLVGIIIDKNVIKDFAKDNKICFRVSPKYSQQYSKSQAGITHDVYLSNKGKIIKIGTGRILNKQNEKEFRRNQFVPKHAERIDFVNVGSMDKEGCVTLNKDILLGAMVEDKQNSVTINFLKFNNTDNFLAYLSDKGNLNRHFDYKITLPRHVVEDSHKLNNLQALQVKKHETRNDMILVTTNSYMNSLNDFIVGDKNTHTIAEHDILSLGWSKGSFERSVADNTHKDKTKGIQKEKEATNIPSIDKIKESKINKDKFNTNMTL